MTGRLIHALAVALLLCSAPLAPRATAQSGADLYQERGCAACHGAQGAAPVLPLYPRLAGQDPEYLFNQASDILSGARHAGLALSMKVSMHTTAQELRAISDYLAAVDVKAEAMEREQRLEETFANWSRAVITGGYRNVDTSPVDPALMSGGDFRKGAVNKNRLPADSLFFHASASPDADRVEQGRILYAAKACVGCHGAEGREAPIPGYPNLAGQSPRYALAQMQFIRDGTRTNGQAMVMKGIVAALSDEELRAIADYLASIP